ncbi:MAG: MarR family winged helix-turn-helix transcriptional regulator [Candidatus Limnocylindrales bacterium]|jgi:DNA-binding MarR family transcriptional regulator
MADKSSVTSGNSRPGAASDPTLETSRLLVEFLHAAYATRRLDADGEEPIDGKARTHGTASVALSAHAVRAAIHVYQHGERTVGQLAAGLGISYGWASRVVEELEAAGYATRERDADDRRVVRVRLNPAKVGEVERAYHWRGESVGAALEPLADSERAAVRVFLRRLTYILREDEAERH